MAKRDLQSYNSPRQVPPLVSIFMFCKNAASTVNRAVDSILAQSYTNIEIVVQDGASTDGTLEILKSYGNKISLLSEPDDGPAEGFIHALKRCQGFIIGSCLSDEELTPQAIEDTVFQFSEYPWVDAITSDAYITDVDGHQLGEYIGKEFNVIDYLIGDYCPYFVSSFFKKSALVSIGLYSSDWNTYGIEFEIWCRLATEKNIKYIGGKKAKYAIHPGQLSNSTKNIEQHYYARVDIINKLFNEKGLFYNKTSWEMEALKCNVLFRNAVMFTNHLIHIESNDNARCMMTRAIEICRNFIFCVATKKKILFEDDKFNELFYNNLSVLLESNVGLDFKKIMGNTNDYTGNKFKLDQLEYKEHCEKPIEIPKLDARYYHYAALVISSRGLIDQSIVLWKSAGVLNNITIDSMLCQAALKHPGYDSKDCQLIQKEWVKKHVPGGINANRKITTKNNKIRVAYFGYDWHAEYMHYQCANFVKHHDKNKFESFCYSGNKLPAYISSAFDNTNIVGKLNSSEFSDLVRSDKIDIAVEISGFSKGHRYVSFADRCAPIQVSYINHNGTSEVPNVDFVLADEISAPKEIDKYYTEKIYRLPGCFTCFSYNTNELPSVIKSPFLINGYITFACFGSGSKINESLIKNWASILHLIPKSKLYIRNNELNTKANRVYLTKLLNYYGVKDSNLMISSGTDRNGILNSYKDVDISLDTWPYCGGNTLAESLWMGVPAISYRGDTFSSAYGASILSGSGLQSLVALSKEEYIYKAVSLANNENELLFYRKNLRKMVTNTEFGNAKIFAKKMELAYCDMLKMNDIN